MGCPLPNGGRPRHTNRKIGGCIGVAALSQRKKHTAPTITVPDLPFASSVAILLMPNIFWFLLVSLLLLNFFVLGNRSLFMQRREGEKKNGGGGGSRLFHIGKRRRGAKLFCKEVQGGQQFDLEVYFKRGPLAKMGKAVKQQSTNNIWETVMLSCTISC